MNVNCAVQLVWWTTVEHDSILVTLVLLRNIACGTSTVPETTLEIVTGMARALARSLIDRRFTALPGPCPDFGGTDYRHSSLHSPGAVHHKELELEHGALSGLHVIGFEFL